MRKISSPSPYPAATVPQVSLSLYRQDPLTFVPLDANTMYLHALRDGLLAFNLREHLSWASPLSCPIRTEPCSSLMSLLAGVRRLHVCDDAILSDPDIIKDEKLHLIGISHALLQLWSRTHSVPTRYLKAAYKNPMEINFQTWRSFVQLNKLEKVPGFQLVMDNSLGGISLVSLPNPDNLDFLLRPSPGTPWSLDDIGGKPIKSNCGYGIFSVLLTGNSVKKSNLALAQVGTRCTLNGTIKPCRDGVTFPLDELEELVNSFSFVEACMLHPILKPGQLATRHFILLVFVNPMKNHTEADKKMWNQELFEKIIVNFGSAFLPDQIEFYPLMPSKRRGKLDRYWCEYQYSDGLLTQKMEKPAYKYLHILKKLALGSSKLVSTSPEK